MVSRSLCSPYFRLDESTTHTYILSCVDFKLNKLYPILLFCNSMSLKLLYKTWTRAYNHEEKHKHIREEWMRLKDEGLGKKWMGEEKGAFHAYFSS